MISWFLSPIRLLFFSVFFVAVLWFALQTEANRRLRLILSEVSAHTIDPISYENFSFNPFTLEFTLSNLQIPQRRLVGVDDQILKRRLLVKVDHINFKMELLEAWQEENFFFNHVQIRGVELGAVVGRDINRVDLFYLPGIFLGLKPGVNGQLTQRIPYEIETLQVEDVAVMFTPSDNSSGQEVVLQNGEITATRLSNRILTDDQVGAMGKLLYKGTLGGRGTFSMHMEIDSFYNLFKRANGRLILKVKSLPAPNANLFLDNLGFRFQFTSGEIALDVDMDIKKSKWVRRRDTAKLIRVEAKPLGYLDPVSRGIVDQLRKLGGNTRFDYWFSGSLGNFRAGPYYFNPSKVF